MQSANLSPALFTLLIEQAAAGAVRPANLIGNITAMSVAKYGDHSAYFEKLAPRQYVVHLKDGDNEVGTSEASTPVEAKLEVLGYLISKVKVK